MKVGDRTAVYRDPITKKNFDGRSTVRRVIFMRPYSDVDNNTIYDCDVVYDGETDIYRRDVSVVLGK